MKFKVYLLFLLFLLPLEAMAAPKISAIKFVGLQRVTPSQLLPHMESKVGQAYSRDRVSRDVKNLYALGYFGAIKVEQQGAGSRISLVFYVRENGLVKKLVIEGTKKVDRAKVRAVVTVKPLLPANQAKIAESIERIRELYRKEGYSQTQVTASTDQTAEGQVVTFKVKENTKVRIKKIVFEGNEVFKDRKLRKMIATKKRGLFSWLTGRGKLKEALLERDSKVITYNYLKKGYMRVQVAEPNVEFSDEIGGLVISFLINEGQRYKISEVGVSGDILTTQAEIESHLKTKKEDYYNQELIEADRLKVQELYGNQGYAFADIRPETRVDDASQTASINYKVAKGNKIFVERINITGNTTTRDKVIRRELQIKENSLYNESLVRLSKRKLAQLGYFENVEFSTPRGSSDNKLILNINVKERRTGTFSVGAGFSSIEKFIFTASVSKQNFLGYGINGFLSAELSGKRQRFLLTYYDPYFLDSHFQFSASGFKLETEFNDFRRDSFGAELKVGRRLFDFTSVSLGYRFEKVKLKEFSEIVPELFKENLSGITSSVNFDFRRDSRDNALLPTKGDYESLSIEYADKYFGSENRFLKVEGNIRYYLPIGKTVLKSNLRMGWIKSLDGKPVPLFSRYFLGGINTLRGYEIRSIGPRMRIPATPTAPDQDFIYGGNKLFLFNIEYEFPLISSAGFRGVLFFDAGNAFAEGENLNPFKSRMNLGAGFRWMSPFGPMRFEWGFPLQRKPGEDSRVFHFSIGSSF